MASTSRIVMRSFSTKKPRLVVLGSGWAAFSLVKHVDHKLFDITFVSPRNHMLFTPLLSSTASGTLEFRSITEPIKNSFRDVDYVQAECTHIDPSTRSITVESKFSTKGHDTPPRSTSIPYDVLAVAVGARNNTFGIPGVEEHSHYLKELADARAIRQALVRNVQAATFPGVSADERARLLHIVVVGGGPTGVELSAEIHDFIKQDLMRLYPEAFAQVQLTIVTGDRLLGSFDASLREYTERRFRRERIRVLTGVNATRVDATELHLGDGSRIPFGLLIWNTGIGPRKLVQSLDAGVFAKDRWGHLVTDLGLRVLGAPAPLPGAAASSGAPAPAAAAPLVTDATWRSLRPLPGVYAMGDCASVGDRHYAATAQVAEQQGRWLAGRLSRAAAVAAKGTPASSALQAALLDDSHAVGSSSGSSSGSPDAAAFEYQHRAALAFVGGFAGVADLTTGVSAANRTPLHGANITGPAAFAVWRSVYLTQLGSWRNRLQVPVDWMRTLVFGRDTTLF